MRFGGMFGVAVWLCMIAVGITVSFTVYKYAGQSAASMDAAKDTRHISERDGSNLAYAYLGRPGAYLDAVRLSVAVGAASADRRAEINLLGKEIEVYDMYSLNAAGVTAVAPEVYEILRGWWADFSSSPWYRLNTVYDYNAPAAAARSFTPDLLKTAEGFTIPNPASLDECRFRLKLADVTEGEEPEVEYHLYIFLGSPVKEGAFGEARAEYRWYECLSKAPFVLMN